MAKLQFDPNSVEPLHRAELGDYRLLAARLRSGTASADEQALAAAIVERAPKPASNHPTSYDVFERDMAIGRYIQERTAIGGKFEDMPDAAVKAAEQHFKVSASIAYAAKARFEAADEARPHSRRKRKR